jgi:hypothetical protein
MAKSVPKFAIRYIPKELLGDIPKYKPVEKEDLSGWTLVAPRRSKPRVQPNAESLEAWTESVSSRKGKRQGWATWTNTKTGVKMRVEFMDDIVKSLRYYKTKSKSCSYCWDRFYVSVEYNHGSIVSSSENCSCRETFYGNSVALYGDLCGMDCTCGSCECKSVERQWNRSHDPHPW